MKFSLKNCSIFSIAGMLFISACGNNPSGSSSKSDSSGAAASGVVDSTSPKTDSAKKDSSKVGMIGNTNPDQATIDYMVPGNTKEIAWLTAGMNKGGKEIKDHAKMMLADHKKLGQQVTTLISGKNLSAPPVDTAGVVNINDLKGKQWDSAWVAKMVMDHQELLTKLKQSETEVKDTALKTLVINTEPVVKHHLDMVKAIQGKMK